VTNLKSGRQEQFPINSYKKYGLENAFDDIDFLLNNTDKIEAFEKR
jgi:3-isopropylmalate/(R)-2-methylmalate dehydratase small subunit